MDPEKISQKIMAFSTPDKKERFLVLPLAGDLGMVEPELAPNTGRF
jgi:hypothetical protein